MLYIYWKRQGDQNMIISSGKE